MNIILQFLCKPTEAPRSVLLVRIAVGVIFFTQGVLKYIDPNMGVVRFTRIGFSHPYFAAHFVATFEILCGLLLLLGIGTRLTSIPVLVVIMTAITTSTGMDVSLVPIPSNSRRPHRISKVATKWAAKYGCENPILVKRTTPMLGSMYFKTPCVKKITPTAMRTSSTLRGASVGLQRN